MIKTVFFDIGGVLLNIYPERTIEYIKTVTKLPEHKIIDSFPEEEHHKYESGKLTDDEFFNAVKYSLSDENVFLNSENFWKAWSMMVGEKTGVNDIMEKLTKRYSIWLLSNTNPYHIIKERRINTFKNIRGAIYSFEVGSRKPEKEIFYKALTMADTTPEQSLFIDDVHENVVAARTMNFNAIHFISTDDLEQNLKYYDVM